MGRRQADFWLRQFNVQMLVYTDFWTRMFKSTTWTKK